MTLAVTDTLIRICSFFNILQPINTEIFENIFVYNLPRARTYGPLFIFIYLYEFSKLSKGMM